MTQTKNARLSAAIATALGGAALTALPLIGQAQDPQAPAGYSATGTGQVVIVPYYTVNNNWNTSINLTNTTDHALLVKVRVHEAQNSRDVLDFNIMLSPKDVWAAYIAAGTGDDAPPRLFAEDNSCTTPAIPSGGAPLLALAYTGNNADGGPTDNARMTEGYVEFLVMGECRTGETCYTSGTSGQTSTQGIAYLITHSDGEPRDCSTARSRSIRGSNVSSTPPNLNSPTSAGEWVTTSGSPAYANNAANVNPLGWGPVRHPAPIKGNVSYVNSVRGGGAGIEALHLDAVVCSAAENGAAQDLSTVYNGKTIIDCGTASNYLATAQEEPYFLEPTIATMPRGLWDVRGLNVLENRFTWSNTFNEWAANEANLAFTDWIINFPTKGFHVDQDCNSIQANNNRWRHDGTTVVACQEGSKDNLFATTGTPAPGDSQGRRFVPDAARLAPFNYIWDGEKSIVEVGISGYDREEQGKASGEPIFSPGSTPGFDLPYEMNVIRFSPDAEADPLGSLISKFLDVPDILGDANAVNGWVNFQFSQTPVNTNVQFNGLPVYGIVLKNRRPNNATHDIGQIMNHGYDYSPR